MDCCPIQRESMTHLINCTFETWDEHLPYKYIYMCLHCSEMYFINSAHIKDNHKTKQSVVWELKSLTLFFFQAEKNNKILLSWLAIASSNCWGLIFINIHFLPLSMFPNLSFSYGNWLYFIHEWLARNLRNPKRYLHAAVCVRMYVILFSEHAIDAAYTFAAYFRSWYLDRSKLKPHCWDSELNVVTMATITYNVC